MSEQNHPWCSNTARDEAIRAAEDAALAERTPLPDHRDLPAAVADLRRRVEGLEAVADHRRRQCEADAENREAAPGSRAGVSDTGLRTERVTLEVTFRRGVKQVSASSWDWFQIVHDGHGLQDLESVRVVEASNEADVAGIEYRGNSVGYWYAKAESYRQVIRDCRQQLAAVNGETLAQAAARLTAERDAALRERDEAREEAEKATTLAKGLEDKRAYFRRQRDVAVQECERLRARVAELQSAPAANAGGEARQEPVAWGVRIDSGRGLYGHYDFEAEARGVCDAVNAEEGWSMTVVPLYAAPQPPRGWLTKNERAAVESARDYFAAPEHDDDECAFLASALRSLLARSTPPRVRRPGHRGNAKTLLGIEVDCDNAWIAAIRGAGGEVE